MATKYTLHFTDTNKPTFDLQAYTTNGPVSPALAGHMDGASAANTTLQLYGKGRQNYGEDVFQNMIYMLENFANSTRPVYSSEGQLWYKKVAGSPAIGEELFIRNVNGNGDDLVDDWDAVILATGTSVMTGDLILSGTPTNPLAAIPLQAMISHKEDEVLHLTSVQNDFLDNLDIDGSPQALTSADVNQLSGISGNVQTLLDDKVALTGDTMYANANLSFAGSPGGEVLGLPTVPSVDDAAASKKYVDDQISSGAGGDGVLTNVAFLAGTGLGSPPLDPSFTTMEFTITDPDTSTITIQAEGISREGHAHEASIISLDNSFNILYPTEVQSAFAFVDNEIATLAATVAAATTTVTVERLFETRASDLTTGTPYEVQSHIAEDNRIFLSVNGVKQYVHAKGAQEILYDIPSLGISPTTFTGLDPAVDYDFNINVDGAGDVTVTIPAGTPVSTHVELASAINNIMDAGSPPLLGNVTFIIDNGSNKFIAYSAGSSSTIALSDPATATYLFDVDAAPDTIVGATFLSEVEAVTGSPPGSPAPSPDSIEVLGDVTASFPDGKTFTIRGSVDPLYGSYDGVYSVHNNGAVASGSPLTTTTIPIARMDAPDTNTPLLPLYVPVAGSPATPLPAPSPYGVIYKHPLAGFDQVLAGVAGIEGDYEETDILGNAVGIGEITSYVVFNYDILITSKIESLLYV